MTQNHIFILSIGPVQSFIAQARKTQDLYAGSQILSQLVEAGINAIPELDREKELIFPYLNDNITTKSLPNRFVAIVNNDE